MNGFFDHVKVGDVVTRMLAGTIPMELKVTRVHEGLIFCGPWTFDAATGAEIDPDLGWGPTRTGSLLTRVNGVDVVTLKGKGT